MLFHELYGTYFAVTAAILKKACAGTLTRAEILRITSEKAFGESVLTIPDALTDGTWPLLDQDLGTPLRHVPAMPLTDLQRRWLRTVLEDPRVRLFAPPVEGLEDVEPLYRREDVVWFDRYGDGDPFDDPSYMAHFRTVLDALREKKRLRIRYAGNRRELEGIFSPICLEYSEKDDKFRLAAAKGDRKRRKLQMINLARILECTAIGPYGQASETADARPEDAGLRRQPAGNTNHPPMGAGLRSRPAGKTNVLAEDAALRGQPAGNTKIRPENAGLRELPAGKMEDRLSGTRPQTQAPKRTEGASGPAGSARKEKKQTVVLELRDRRNALERALLHFSDLEKETVRLGEDLYEIRLRFRAEDLTEILIRVLSFGPMIRATAPDSFVEKIRERIRRQEAYMLP